MNRPTSVAYQVCDSHYSCRLQVSPRDAYRRCFSSSVPSRHHQKITADVFRGAPVSAQRAITGAKKRAPIVALSYLWRRGVGLAHFGSIATFLLGDFVPSQWSEKCA